MAEITKDEKITALRAMNDALERKNRTFSAHARALTFCKKERRRLKSELAALRERWERGRECWLIYDKHTDSDFVTLYEPAIIEARITKCRIVEAE